MLKIKKNKKNARTLVKDGEADFIQDHHSMYWDRWDKILPSRRLMGLLAPRSKVSERL